MDQKNTSWNWKLIISVLTISYVVIFFRMVNISMYDDTKARDFYHGDSYSDKNAHSTGMYMFDYGFLHSKLLPVWKYKGDHDTTKVSVYTHYPALPDVLAGVYAKLFNSKNEIYIRIIPVALSLVFVGVIFFVLNLFIEDKQKTTFAACVILLSNYFVFWADNLHKHQYEELLKWVFVGLMYWYYKNNKTSTWALLCLMLIYIVNANISFEPIVYFAVVTVGFALIYDKSIFTKETILLGFAAVAGFSLHLLQNYYYLGSIDLVLQDMSNAATLRTVGTADVSNELGRSLTWLDFANIPNLIQMRIERVFLIPGIAFFVFAFLAFKKLKKEQDVRYKIMIVLLVASLSWALVMTQHFTVHCFTIRQWGVFYALILGFGLYEYWELYKNHIKKSKKWLVLHYVFLLYIAIMAVSQHVMDYFRYGILY